MAEQRYPRVEEVIIAGAINALPDLHAEIERLNAALDASAAQARHLRHEIDMQTARANLAESKLRWVGQQTLKRDARMRNAAGLLRELVSIATRYTWSDGIRWRHCCDSEHGRDHREDCAARRALEWLG